MLTKSSRFIEYMKVHLISLEQDYDKYPDGDRDSVIHLNGQILATKHLLSVALDIMEQSNQGEWAINE
jgi:hypothetical protein